MCGISAFIANPSSKEVKLKQYFKDLKIIMYSNMSRGEKGTGIYSNGEIIKDNVRADEFFSKHKEELANEFISSLVIAHSRQPSMGFSSNDKTHPFKYDNVIGVHNGTLKNTFDLRDKYKMSYVQNEIDSELLYSILDKQYDNEKKEFDFHILNDYEGIATLVFIDVNNPDKLFIYGDKERPIYYGTLDKGNVLFISSEKTGLEQIEAESITQFETEKLTVLSYSNGKYTIEIGKNIVRKPHHKIYNNNVVKNDKPWYKDEELFINSRGDRSKPLIVNIYEKGYEWNVWSGAYVNSAYVKDYDRLYGKYKDTNTIYKLDEWTLLKGKLYTGISRRKKESTLGFIKETVYEHYCFLQGKEVTPIAYLQYALTLSVKRKEETITALKESFSTIITDSIIKTAEEVLATKTSSVNLIKPKNSNNIIPVKMDKKGEQVAGSTDDGAFWANGHLCTGSFKTLISSVEVKSWYYKGMYLGNGLQGESLYDNLVKAEKKPEYTEQQLKDVEEREIDKFVSSFSPVLDQINQSIQEMEISCETPLENSMLVALHIIKETTEELLNNIVELETIQKEKLKAAVEQVEELTYAH